MATIARLDAPGALRKALAPHCRLSYGEIWQDPVHGHRVGCLDAASASDAAALMDGHRAVLAAHDPPYNLIIGKENTPGLGRVPVQGYVDWCRKWITNSLSHLSRDAHLYIWMGADQRDGFQPLPDVMLLLRSFDELAARSFITLRNQRGYGTQKNWMAVRQELLYYVRGNPGFNVTAEYTDIPKKVGGYLKQVGGHRTENRERGKSDTVRAGNVWTDVQQIFYRLHENVPGCYAQKPLKAVERVLLSGACLETDGGTGRGTAGDCGQGARGDVAREPQDDSGRGPKDDSGQGPQAASGRERAGRPGRGEVVMDFFAHSGTTLLAAERLGMRCMTMDLDPVFAEVAIRRLERYRNTGRTGWQRESPFPEAGELGV